MSTTRRNMLATAAALPVLAVPGAAASVADTELLALGVQLEGINREYRAQQAIDRARCSAAREPALTMSRFTRGLTRQYQVEV